MTETWSTSVASDGQYFENNNITTCIKTGRLCWQRLFRFKSNVNRTMSTVQCACSISPGARDIQRANARRDAGPPGKAMHRVAAAQSSFGRSCVGHVCSRFSAFNCAYGNG